MSTPERQWPAPYLQPNPREDCGYYATAYICRCLGHAGVTAEQVKAWCAETRRYEGMFPSSVLGCAVERFWRHLNVDEAEQRRFWLGAGTREWVEKHLGAGEIALALVHRIPEMAHAVVLLESCGDAGVLLMDPIYGHVTETWDWFLGIGPGLHGCHHVDGWYGTCGSEAQR